MMFNGPTPFIRDSLLMMQKSKTLQAMHIRYETEKKEQKIGAANQNGTEQPGQAPSSNNQQILIGALLIGFSLVAAIR